MFNVDVVSTADGIDDDIILLLLSGFIVVNVVVVVGAIIFVFMIFVLIFVIEVDGLLVDFDGTCIYSYLIYYYY